MLYIVETRGWPIYDQLLFEEGILRATPHNLLLINYGSPPAIVLGISGKPHEWINMNQVHIPVIRRFSGGGCVVVDENTLFVTLIFNQEDTGIALEPKPILQWTEQIWKPALPPSFALRENDYALGERKFGGNAQYITKHRFLHHSTLLWDFNPAHMQLLTMPPRVPDYRKGRTHKDFLCTLKEHFASPEKVVEGLKNSLAQRYRLVDATVEELRAVPSRVGTERLA